MNAEPNLRSLQKAILSSPLFLAKVCGYDKFVDPIYKDWERKLIELPKRSLYLKPRGTYKSTLYSVIYPAWRLLRNPNIRILIICRTRPDSESIITEIKHNILLNPIIEHLFGLNGFIIRRDTNNNIAKHKVYELNLTTRTDYIKRGANLSVYGMKSSAIGKHGDLMILDDPCDDHDKFSATVRKKRVSIHRQNVKVIDEGGDIMIVGTRKHQDDLFGYVIDVIQPQYQGNNDLEYVIEIETPYYPDGTLRFPTYLPEKLIQQNMIDMGTHEYSCEMLNEPRSDEELVFLKEDFTWFDYKKMLSEIMESRCDDFKIYVYVDLAISEQDKADYTAITIGAKEEFGVDRKRSDKIYIMDGVLTKANPTKVYDLLISLNEKYRQINKNGFERVGIESNNFQKSWRLGFEDYIKQKGIQIRTIGVLNITNKRARIMPVQPLIQTGKVLFPDDSQLRMRDYFLQLLDYPTLEHDDAPDSLAGLVRMIRSSVSTYFTSV